MPPSRKEITLDFTDPFRTRVRWVAAVLAVGTVTFGLRASWGLAAVTLALAAVLAAASRHLRCSYVFDGEERTLTRTCVLGAHTLRSLLCGLDDVAAATVRGRRWFDEHSWEYALVAVSRTGRVIRLSAYKPGTPRTEDDPKGFDQAERAAGALATYLRATHVPGVKNRTLRVKADAEGSGVRIEHVPWTFAHGVAETWLLSLGLFGIPLAVLALDLLLETTGLASLLGW